MPEPKFKFMPPGLYSAMGLETVSPSDSNDLPFLTRGLYVGTAGHVKVTMADGSVGVLKSLSGGIVHPLSVRRVWSTGTTALDIIALY